MESTEMLEMELKAMKEPRSSSTSIALRNMYTSVWPSVKPFVNGCLTGQLMNLQSWVAYWFLKDYLAAADKNLCKKILPMGFLFHATFTSARFGIFETLTEKAAASSGGRSITLYQEACCGLMSGAIGASIYYPILAHTIGQPFEQKWDYRNLTHSLCSSIRKDGLLALWKGSGPYIAEQMAFNMGMLASYRRSLNYFEESIGVGGTKAQLGAGVVSAFFAVACSNSCELMVIIKNALRQDAGKKYPYSYIPLVAFQVLKPGGSFKFYTKTFNKFAMFAPSLSLQWLALENIREIEVSNGF